MIWCLNKVFHFYPTSKNKKIVSKVSLIDEIINENIEVLVTIGAGDIGEMILDIKDNLLKRWRIFLKH